MKTLVEATDTSATYEFAHGSASRVVTYEKLEGEEGTADFAAMAESDHAKWLVWLGVS
jgi:hypothetical protein